MTKRDFELLVRFEQGRLSDNETVALFQRLIDSGDVWTLQGTFGRFAIWLIHEGKCAVSQKPSKCYRPKVTPFPEG